MNFFGIVLPVILFVLIVIMVFKSGAETVAMSALRQPRLPGKAKPKTMYETLGGAPAIDAAVDIFYRRVLADAYIKPFFEGIDMDKQAAKQKAFLTMVFGGPNNYTGKDMREGHRHLVKNMGLNDSHFDHVLAHLRSTLAELGVGEDLIQTVIDTAETTRDDVLDKGEPEAKKTMYETLGGAPAIDAAVDIFYRRVLADAYIKPFFEGIDMDKQAAKQKAFLTMVFGGPNNYTGKDMREGHRHLVKNMGLNDSHFDHVLAHLRSTLAELGVGEDLIQVVIDTAETTRDDVLDR